MRPVRCSSRHERRGLVFLLRFAYYQLSRLDVLSVRSFVVIVLQRSDDIDTINTSDPPV